MNLTTLWWPGTRGRDSYLLQVLPINPGIRSSSLLSDVAQRTEPQAHHSLLSRTQATNAWGNTSSRDQSVIKRYAENGIVFLFCIIEDVINCNNSGNVSYVRPSSHHLFSSWLSTVNTFHMQCLKTCHVMFISIYNCNINPTYILYWCLWRNCEWISPDLGSLLKAKHRSRTKVQHKLILRAAFPVWTKIWRENNTPSIER